MQNPSRIDLPSNGLKAYYVPDGNSKAVFGNFFQILLLVWGWGPKLALEVKEGKRTLARSLERVGMQRGGYKERPAGE